MKKVILRVLTGADGFVSGQELCDQLGVSRTAVWKMVNQLREEGYEIESLPRKGYRILKRPDCITAEEVASRLQTRWAGREVYYRATTGSTNTDAAALAQEGKPEGTLVLAEEQTQGKGRRGRSWVTPAGSAATYSLIVRPQIAPQRAAMVTLVMGMAVASACRSCLGVKAGIKWPNDVVAQGRKICGILTEMNCEVGYIRYLVIGVGINTAVDSFPEELQDKAISLHQLVGYRPDRAGLIAACMKEFECYYEKFIRTGDFTLLQEDYNRMLLGVGGKVRVLQPGAEYTGVSEGVNEFGELLVRREDGKLERVFAGEVSVRGIYGYV